MGWTNKRLGGVHTRPPSLTPSLGANSTSSAVEELQFIDMEDDLKRCITELQLGINVEENFGWIFRQYYRLVFRFFRGKGIEDIRCDDLTQEVFIRVYRGIASFRGEASFETWLFRISWNLWSKSLRRTTPREVSLDESGESEEAAVIKPMALLRWEQDDPLGSALREEQRVLLYQELQEMPPQMRRCIVLRVQQGLKYREIAALMQISIDAVKSHLSQARFRLKSRLGTFPDG